MKKKQKAFTWTLISFAVMMTLMQSCVQIQVEESPAPTEEKISAQTATQTKTPATQTAQASATPTEMAVVISAPTVRLSVVKGNLFIRRGPDMAYNPVGVFYKDTTADIVARDVLSKWAQIVIPNSTQTGWVSLQTKYSKVEGDLSALPEFKIKDWPIAGYVRNCTNHGILLTPGEIYIEAVFRKPENVVWVYPGHYQVYDIDTPDIVQLESIDTREGLTVDIGEDGAGDRRKCPP